MDFFDIDILEGRVSKYETNHIHMIVDGNVALPITSMRNKDYGTFLHEYIHYYSILQLCMGLSLIHI